MKKIMAIVLAGVMLLSLGGCGTADFDAKGYVQAIMDAKFKREYADYAKVVGISEEEAKEELESEFKQLLETAMNESLTELGITATEDEMAQYIQLEVDVRAKVQYTVKNAVKDGEGNYTVDVEIKPVAVSETWKADLNAKLTVAIQNGATKDQYMGIILESFKICVESAEAGEAVKFTFHVTGEESGKNMVYGVSEEEMKKVDLLATGQGTE